MLSTHTYLGKKCMRQLRSLLVLAGRLLDYQHNDHGGKLCLVRLQVGWGGDESMTAWESCQESIESLPSL